MLAHDRPSNHIHKSSGRQFGEPTWRGNVRIPHSNVVAIHLRACSDVRRNNRDSIAATARRKIRFDHDLADLCSRLLVRVTWLSPRMSLPRFLWSSTRSSVNHLLLSILPLRRTTPTESLAALDAEMTYACSINVGRDLVGSTVAVAMLLAVVGTV